MTPQRGLVVESVSPERREMSGRRVSLQTWQVGIRLGAHAGWPWFKVDPCLPRVHSLDVERFGFGGDLVMGFGNLFGGHTLDLSIAPQQWTITPGSNR